MCVYYRWDVTVSASKHTRLFVDFVACLVKFCHVLTFVHIFRLTVDSGGFVSRKRYGIVSKPCMPQSKLHSFYLALYLSRTLLHHLIFRRRVSLLPTRQTSRCNLLYAHIVSLCAFACCRACRHYPHYYFFSLTTVVFMGAVDNLNICTQGAFSSELRQSALLNL